MTFCDTYIRSLNFRNYKRRKIKDDPNVYVPETNGIQDTLPKVVTKDIDPDIKEATRVIKKGKSV